MKKRIFYIILILAIIGAFLDLLTQKSENKPLSERVLNTNNVNTRAGPGKDFKKAEKFVRYGDTLQILKDTAGWVKFHLSNWEDCLTGWVKKEFTIPLSEWEGKQKTTHDQIQTKDVDVLPTSYKIVSTNNMSRKSTVKPLSEYSTSELANIPKKKKMEYNIAVGDTIRKEQIRPTAKKIIQDITSKDPEVDEVILNLNANDTMGSSPYDIAQCIWAPEGELGVVTPSVAESNIRDRYELSISYRDDLETYLKKKRKGEKRFGLSEETRKEIYYAFVKAEDKAIRQADKKYSIGSEKHSNTVDSLRKKFEEEVYKRYDINEETGKKIYSEGARMNWEVPKF